MKKYDLKFPMEAWCGWYVSTTTSTILYLHDDGIVHETTMGKGTSGYFVTEADATTARDAYLGNSLATNPLNDAFNHAMKGV